MSVPAEMMGAPPVEAPMGPPPVAGEMAPPPVGPEEGGAPVSPLEPEEELDADIALGLMLATTFQDETTDQLIKTTDAENPAPLMANMAVTMVNQIDQQMRAKGMPLSERMWLAEGGAIDRWIDNVKELLEKDGFEVDERLAGMIMAEAVDQLKLSGQAGKNGAGAPPPVGPEGPPPPGDPTMMAPPPVGGAM